MKYFSIQGIDKPCSSLVMGSVAFRPDALDRTFALMDEYVALGGNAVDLAYIYNGGGSEIAFGKWLAARGARDRLTIIDKGAHHDANGPRVNPEAIRRDLRTGLERMGIGSVDLYMLHRDDTSVPVSEIMDALHEEKRAGRLSAIGVSNWTVDRIDEANAYARARGQAEIAANSPNLSLAVPVEPRWAGCVHADERTRAWHARTQMPLLSWSSQAGGFFTGRFAPEDRGDPEMVRTYYSGDNWERLRRARELGAKRGVGANTVALAFVLHQPFPIGALIGPMTVEELRSSFQASAVSLTQEEMDWLDLKRPAP